jgi:hypothetical protein
MGEWGGNLIYPSEWYKLHLLSINQKCASTIINDYLEIANGPWFKLKDKRQNTY